MTDLRPATAATARPAAASFAFPSPPLNRDVLSVAPSRLSPASLRRGRQPLRGVVNPTHIAGRLACSLGAESQTKQETWSHSPP